VHLKKHGESKGEWRSGGAQTIIYGQHPEGHQYQIVQNLPAKLISFDQIVWSAGVRPPVSNAETGFFEVHRTDKSKDEENNTHSITAFSHPQSSSVFLSLPQSSSVLFCPLL